MSDELLDAFYEAAVPEPLAAGDGMGSEDVRRGIGAVGRQIAEKLLAWPADSSVPVGVVASLVREWTGADHER